MTQPLQEGVGPIGGNNEPTLEINQTNPYNIAINSSWTFSLSNDYGATFTHYSFTEPPGTGSISRGGNPQSSTQRTRPTMARPGIS